MLKQSLFEEKIALHNVRSFIRYLKENGRKRVDAIQLMVHFNYSPEQIHQVMKRLEQEGIVKEE